MVQMLSVCPAVGDTDWTSDSWRVKTAKSKTSSGCESRIHPGGDERRATQHCWQQSGILVNGGNPEPATPQSEHELIFRRLTVKLTSIQKVYEITLANPGASSCGYTRGVRHIRMNWV